MNAKLLLLVCFMTCCLASYGQKIKPSDLIQLYKFAQLNESKFGLSAYQYLKTVDDKWNMVGNPDETVQGINVTYAYSLDKKVWYLPEVYGLMISRTYGPPDERTVIYQFKEMETWTLYRGQMVLMDAKTLSTGPKDGGMRYIYLVNDLAFMMTEFPPGVNGEERSYQVAILPFTQK